MKALIGNKQQVFLINDRNDVLGHLAGIRNNEHIPTIANKFRATYEQLKESGTTYLVCPIPDKAEIYNNLVPKCYKIKKPTPLDIFFKSLSKDAYVDIRPVFSACTRSVYYNCDTHLNFYGVYMCYVSLITSIKKVYPNIPDAITLDKIELTEIGYKSSDLFNFVRTCNGEHNGEYNGELFNFVPLVNQLNKSRYANTCYHVTNNINLLIEIEWFKQLDNYIEYIRFDSDEYLKLNPNVTIDAAKHYLHCGMFNEKQQKTPLSQFLKLSGTYTYLDEVKRDWVSNFLGTNHAKNMFKSVFGEIGIIYLLIFQAQPYNVCMSIPDRDIKIDTVDILKAVHRLDSYKTSNPNKSLPTALISHDSYFNCYMLQLLSLHFRELLFVWNDDKFPVDYVKNNKIDIVIHEVAGRFLV